MDFLRRRLPLILGGLAFLVLAPQYWVALHTPAVGIYHDDSIYLLTAKSLAEGHGYRIPSTPTNMVQTKYPILYPAILSLVWRLCPDFPANVIWFKALSLTFCLGWLWLSALMLLRWFADTTLTVSLIALIAACPQVIFLSTTALSEMLFSCLLTGCLLLMLREETSHSSSCLVGAGILAGGCFLTRSVGFVVLMVPTFYLLFHRPWKRAVWFGLPAALLTAPWLWWQFLNYHAGLDPYLSHANYYSGYNVLLNYTWLDKGRIVALNLFHLLLSTYGLFCDILPKELGFLISIVVFAFGLRGSLRDQSRQLLRWAALGNLLILMLWVWPPLRFLIPWLPILMGIVWCGVPVRFRKYGLAMVWILFACALISDSRATRQALETGFWCPSTVGSQDWSAFVSLAQWAKSNTDPLAVFQSNIDPTVYLYTGRKSIRGFRGNVALGQYLQTPYPLGTTEEFRATLIRSKVKFLFVVDWTWFPETKYLKQFLVEMEQGHPGELRMVHRGSPGFGIYRFDVTPSALSLNAH